MAEQNIDVPQDKQINSASAFTSVISLSKRTISLVTGQYCMRLEGIAEPGGISISDDAVGNCGKVDVTFEDLGSILEEYRRTDAGLARPIRSRRAGAPNRWPVDETLALPNKPSIAVLPFTNLSSDPEQEYFADGMVETHHGAVSFQGAVRHRPQFELHIQGARRRREAGRARVGVSYVLEGSVRKSANRCAHGTARRYRHWGTSLGRTI